MAGLTAVKSKLKYLSSKSFEKVRGRQQSVVFMNDDGSIDWPENPNSTGVLCVPKACKTLDAWQGLNMANNTS